jgi:hypothetical protein
MNKVKLLGGDIGLAIVDIGLPDRKSDVLVGKLRALHPQLPIMIAMGHDSAEPGASWPIRTGPPIRKPCPQDDLGTVTGRTAAALMPRRCARAVRSATTARGRREGMR